MGLDFDALFPMALDAWVVTFDKHSDIARRASLVPFLDWYDERPRDLISALAWVRAKTKSRRRRLAIAELLDKVTTRRARAQGRPHHALPA